MFLMSKFQLREVEVFTSRRLKILQNYTSHHFVCPDILNVPRFRKTGKQIGRLFNLIGKDYWSVKALCSLSYYTTIHSQKRLKSLQEILNSIQEYNSQILLAENHDYATERCNSSVHNSNSPRIIVENLGNIPNSEFNLTFKKHSLG